MRETMSTGQGTIVCAICSNGPRFRYPGGDPENGPAERRCKCEVAPWDEMTDEEWEAVLEEDCRIATGGQHHFVADEGYGELPGTVTIECCICGKSLADYQRELKR